jgi:hypothetical protein
LAALEKDYEEVGAESAEDGGEDDGEEYWAFRLCVQEWHCLRLDRSFVGVAFGL